jgi:hypothetical protein
VIGKLLCALGFHRWSTRFNDSGQNYRECERCKKYRDITPMGGGAAPFG